MKKNLKNNKKKGFTLVELIAVIAIIGILAAILVPTISGFISKAKKTKVVEQARQFCMAVESIAAEGKLPSTGTTDNKNSQTPDKLKGVKEFYELCGFDNAMADADLEKIYGKLGKNTNYDTASKITSGADFKINDNGVFTELVPSTN